MPDSPAELMVERLKKDPLHSVTANELGDIFEHLHHRFDDALPPASSLQHIVKKVIRSVAAAENEIDVEDAESAVRSARTQLTKSHHELSESQRRLAELTGTTPQEEN